MKDKQRKYDYYTPVSLAKSLLQLIPESHISTVIDICCGSWNLLSAASEKYPTAHITGVDVNTNVKTHQLSGSDFSVCDGRDFALEKHLCNITYDLILSNPPFGMLPKEDRRFDSTKELSEYYSGLTSNRYECEMIHANLLLAHSESVLMFILPSTFVLGDTFKKARCQFSSNFHLHSIVKLPHDTFCRGRINTFAIILTKHKNETHEHLKLYDAENQNGWTIKPKGHLNYEHTLEGFWWAYPEKCLDQKNCNIHRGTISSSCFASSGNKVIHCAAKQETDWQPSMRYFDPKKAPTQILYAEQGDIIIDRIGKGAGYWCINTYGHTPVSDCIFVLSNAPDNVVTHLQSHSNNGKLNIPTRGVATPYITKQDILALLGSVPNHE